MTIVGMCVCVCVCVRLRLVVSSQELTTELTRAHNSVILHISPSCGLFLRAHNVSWAKMTGNGPLCHFKN